jgi:hypothetical protein
MILQKDTSVESFSIGNTTIKGTIDANKVGKMFQLLSNLYSDKESIVLQEITANAQDSYKRIGKEGEVNIKFDSTDRTLHIIDKAEGISPYVFENYITKLGSSSKELEDDSAGMLGIGFFSGWCVTNCVYLTTVYENVKYIYSCTKRDYEEPEFNLLLEEETDLENGTDYWFYLPKSNYSYKDTEKEKFEKALDKLRYFHNVTVEGLRFNNNYNIYQGKTFVFNESYFNSQYDRDYKELEICFGNTPYPINWEKIDIPKITIPVALKFELNEPLMILPSREALGWNNTTIDVVKNKIIDFVQEITGIYKEQTNPFDNILDYLKARDNKQRIKIGNSNINISSLKLESDLKYSKIAHLDIKIPTDTVDIFVEFVKTWDKLYKKKFKPSFYDNAKFYYSEQGLKKNKTSQINYDCIFEYKPGDYINQRYYFNPSPLFATDYPDNAFDQIREFLGYVKEDVKARFLDYDSIVPAKRFVNTVKRTNEVILAAFNGDVKKVDYNISNFTAPKYLFLTSDLAEYNEICEYTNSFFGFTKDRKTHIVNVIFTAKKYNRLFSGCNIITLEDWFKSDMFINAFRRSIDVYNHNKLDSYLFKEWLRKYNKRLYYIQKNTRTDYNDMIINKGLELGIKYPDNYADLRKHWDIYTTIENDKVYRKDKIINFLRNKLNKCKKGN